jgi:hypothetical protein
MDQMKVAQLAEVLNGLNGRDTLPPDRLHAGCFG